MDCKFFVGQKVTPIYDCTWSTKTAHGIIPCENPPKFGEIYTITGFNLSFHVVAIYLEGISSPYETGYVHTAFRPVVDKDTDATVEELKKIALGLDALDPVEENT